MKRAPIAAGLLLGVLADECFGDPQRRHPVAGFGIVAARLEARVYADNRGRGAVFALAALVPLLLSGAFVQRVTRHSRAATTVSVAGASWIVLGGRSLRRAGSDVQGALDRAAAADLDPSEARALLPTLCGRDPARLDPAGLARATVESVAENTSDAVVAPLVWGALGGVPGLLGYRAVNTLDAMVGHRSARYTRFGTFAARLDDAANLIPSRLTAVLTVVLAPLVGGSRRHTFAVWRRDARQHPSPNAGHCEAAFAAALARRLGGPIDYGSYAEARPSLGDGPPPDADDIGRAVRLSQAVEFSAVALCSLAVLAIGFRPPRVRSVAIRGTR
ncbi:MAG: cobalamin biosynthesis protein CobD [Frankiales bacterium]|nr:cobalamin biosynthesis protein CobD [Frankiales bacterium]